MRVVEPTASVGAPAGGRAAGRRAAGRAACSTWCSTRTSPATAPSTSASPSRAGGGRQQHRAGPGHAVGRRQRGWRTCKVIFSQKPKVASSAALRLPHRRGARRHAVPDAGRPLQPQGGRADARQPPSARWCASTRTAACRADNPFVGRAGALPEIWSYGHRNAQGATLAPDGTLLDARARPAGRRRDQRAAGRAQLRLAGHHLWRELRRRQDRRGHHRQGRHGAAAALLGAVDRAVGHGLPDQRPLRRGAGRATCSSAR